MPSLTDTAIRQALKRVELSRKQENLADGEGRGTGRLVLVLKPMPKRVTADWMAQQWRDGKRTKKKIGAYPSTSLAEAREIYKRDYAYAQAVRTARPVAGGDVVRMPFDRSRQDRRRRLASDHIDIPDLLFEQLTRIARPDPVDHGRTKHD
jgi:hypothetical protein